MEEEKSERLSVSNTMQNLKYYLDKYSKANANERKLIKNDINYIINNTDGRIPQDLLFRVQSAIGGVSTLSRG